MKMARTFGFMDEPKDDRRMHVDATPRIGGVAIFLALFVGILIAGEIVNALPYLCGGIIVLAVGMIDDKKGVSPMFKIAGQALAAIVLCVFGLDLQFVTLFGVTFDLWIFAWPVTVIWVVAITNMVNLIDGLDGLCTGISVFGCGGLALATVIFGHGGGAEIALLLLCAGIGFLPHNVSPAKSFLGDAGSMFFGFMLSALSISEVFHVSADSMSLLFEVESAPLSAFTPIALLAIPIFDTCFAIVRRKLSGQRIFEGDKKHVHHRLSARYGQKGAVALIYGACAVLVGIALLLNIGLAGEIVGVILLILALVYAILRFGVYKG
jgi:UDP-GlcNAc:undecaprenyl-phosphate GlcNAc-1-phosphate transferase